MREDNLTNALGSLDGEQIPGGCEYCNAFQVVKPIKNGIWDIEVFHDKDCPTLRAHR